MSLPRGHMCLIAILAGWVYAGGVLAEDIPRPVKSERKAPADKTKTEKDQEDVETEDETTVTVTTPRPMNRIDRQVYDTAKDPDNRTGTAADALAKVPGVTVTPSGDVTLRGNTVEILVNGKPAPMLSGDNRAAALRAMPSGMISSIEVMSNPGAQYGANGAGGVINIVTRSAMPPGGMGSLSAQLISTGGFMTSAFGTWNSGKLSLNAAASASRQMSETRYSSDMIQKDAAGNRLQTTSGGGRVAMDSRPIFANANLDYTLTEKDTLSGQLTYSRMRMDSRRTGATTSRGPANQRIEQYNSEGSNRFTNRSDGLAITWTHAGRQIGEALKVDARLSRNRMDGRSDNLITYRQSALPANTGQRLSVFDTATDQTTGAFSVDYNTSIGGNQLTAGVLITHDDYASRNLASRPYTPGVETPEVNDDLSSRFTYRQTLSAAYVTWQVPVGERWTVLGGLRAETLDFRSALPAGRGDAAARYTLINPSLFASYVMSETRHIRLSYAHRPERPAPYDLNPAATYVNAQTVAVGSLHLKPQSTDSFEAAYEYVRPDLSWSLRGYHLETSRVINPVSRFIPDPQNTGNPVIETTRRNAGSRHQTGAQFAFNGHLTRKLSLDASASLYTVHLRAPDLPRVQALTTIDGRVSLNWSADNGGSVNISYIASGRRLTGDGAFSGSRQVDMQYSRNLSQKTRLMVMVNDVFRSAKTAGVHDTPYVYSAYANSQQGPSLYIGLSRNFSFGAFAP